MRDEATYKNTANKEKLARATAEAAKHAAALAALETRASEDKLTLEAQMKEESAKHAAALAKAVSVAVCRSGVYLNCV